MKSKLAPLLFVMLSMVLAASIRTDLGVGSAPLVEFFAELFWTLKTVYQLISI